MSTNENTNEKGSANQNRVHPNEFAIPANVQSFIKDAGEQKQQSRNERLEQLAKQCDGLVIAWNEVHQPEKSELARASAVLYRQARYEKGSAHQTNPRRLHWMAAQFDPQPENTNEKVSAPDNALPAYEVIYADGTSYVTSMSKTTTLEKARAYFIDASIEQPDGSCKRVADVKPVNEKASADQNVRPNNCYGGPKFYRCHFCNQEIEWTKFGSHTHASETAADSQNVREKFYGCHSKPVKRSLAILDSIGAIDYVEGSSTGNSFTPFSVKLSEGAKRFWPIAPNYGACRFVCTPTELHAVAKAIQEAR